MCKNINKLYVDIIYFWLGSGLAQITVNMGKYYIGRLRPHFLYVCKPDIDCTSRNLYIIDYKCTNPDISLVNNSR